MAKHVEGCFERTMYSPETKMYWFAPALMSHIIPATKRLLKQLGCYISLTNKPPGGDPNNND